MNKFRKTIITFMQKKQTVCKLLWFLYLPKFGAAHLIQTLTQRQRKISLKNSRKNESGNGMRLTQKFLSP